MTSIRSRLSHWWYLVGVVVAFLLGFGLVVNSDSTLASLNMPTNESLPTTPAPTATSIPGTTNTPASTPVYTPTACPGAYHYLLPQSGSPSNGGTAYVGDRLTLDMMVSSGPYYVMSQQSFLTFTNSLLQNVRAASAGCTLTNTVTGDFEVFDFPLLNQVCNGPAPCVFGGTTRDPGSMAWASSALQGYNGADFRIAQVAFCATAPGQAIIRWQFSPPAPDTTNTLIVDSNSNEVNVPACYVDYVLKILPAIYTSTPSPDATDTPTPGTSGTPTTAPTSRPTITPGGPTLTPTPTTCPGAYHYFLPQPGSPPNGGTASVGDRLTLDMMVNSGSYSINSQQAYLTFTDSLLQNVRASSAGCVLTSTITNDPTIFDVQLQNEVCNGPLSCDFGGVPIAPGSMAYSSSSIINPSYNGPDFRVAQVGFCVIAPGQAIIHWQFSPPAPRTRDTEITDTGNNVVNIPACYVDYLINIPGATYTPTNTPTNTQTYTRTITRTPTSTRTSTHTYTPTNTRTNTPSSTPTITPGGPTLTPTDVPTHPPSDAQLLVVHTVWQGILQPSIHNSLPITFALKLGTTEINYYKQTDHSGFFTVTLDGLENGTYDWRAKGHTSLAQSGQVTLQGDPVTNLDIGTMRAGDSNDDNMVTASDFVILKFLYGRLCYPGTWQADFNNDCAVNAIDFTLMKTNFGIGGAPPIGPGSP